MRYSGQPSSSIDARDLDASPVATVTQVVAESRYPYTKKVKTTTKLHSTTLATRAVSTAGNEPLATSSCIPSSICVDKISPCGHRYGG
jgi:hypothetical protein